MLFTPNTPYFYFGGQRIRYGAKFGVRRHSIHEITEPLSTRVMK